MAESFYTYLNRFPDFKKLITTEEDLKSEASYGTCQSFKNSELNRYNGVDEKFLNTCTKISKNIKDIIINPESPAPAFCIYINYWFYEKLKENEAHTYSSLLNKFYDTIDNLAVCKQYNNDISQNIYDLYEPFIKFKTESTQQGFTSCEDLKKCVKLYGTYAEKCRDNYNNYFCWKLKNFREEYEDHRPNVIGCIEEMKYLEPIKSDLAATISLSFVLMTLISFILLYSYKFTSFGPWISTKLGGKNRTNKLDKRIQRLQNTSENDGTRYKLPYHSS
ncbi:PIR protein [Plasmodium vivax]|uniref:VIR protein n=1 Tax=Plasmodium vivax TaxID=5855 RepID=A0A565A605_PLAVI|nr:PIR protein [Plasmodium vivax]